MEINFLRKNFCYCKNLRKIPHCRKNAQKLCKICTNHQKIYANLPTVLNIYDDKLIMINLFTGCGSSTELNPDHLIRLMIICESFLHFCARFSGEKNLLCAIENFSVWTSFENQHSVLVFSTTKRPYPGVWFLTQPIE